MVIYEPKGKAREYCELSVNLYRGCSHGCVYCYAPNVLRMNREQFCNPSPRKQILEQIKKEAPLYAGREIHLCFTCDPYQQIDVEYGITREAIKILHSNGITVRILTKGGARSERDFDLLSANPQLSIYGATLTFINDSDSLAFEPMASLPSERMAALKKAKENNIKTWVSFEPVIDPEQVLKLIDSTHEYVDKYAIGKWNYDARANEIDWKRFGNEAVALLRKYEKNYLIKKDLLILMKA